MKDFLKGLVIASLAFFCGALVMRHHDSTFTLKLMAKCDSLKSVASSATIDRDNCNEMWQQQVKGLVIVKDALDSAIKVIYIDKKLIDAVEIHDYFTANRLRIQRNSILSDIYLFHLK